MANYSDIRGYRVKYLSSDPTLSTANEGQVWYNSTEGTLKALVQIKAWSAGGNLNYARSTLAGVGTQTAGLVFGGNPPINDSTEEYNGYAWSYGGNLNLGGVQLSGAGTQTAALGFARYVVPTTSASNATESYNGSTWTSVNK